MNINLIQILAAVLLMALLFWLVLAQRQKRADVTVRAPRQKGFRRTWRKIHLLPIGLHRLLGWMPGHGIARPTVEFANIGEGTYGDGIKSYVPDAATTSRYLLYKRGTDADHCAITGAGDDPLGPSDDAADAGIPIAIKLLGAHKGTMRVVTDGTVVDGDYCKCGAVGKITKATTGDLSFGRAQIGTDTSKADGDVIGLIPALPAKYSF